MTAGFFSKRPWLLVWVAFIVLIAAWVATYMVSRRVPSQKLTPAEETLLLRKKEAQ